MSFAQLRAFHAVVTQGSIQNAALKLNLSQPAVSLHIKNLESDNNKCLFRRTGHRLELNEDGQALFEATSRMMLAERDARRILAPGSDQHHGTLVVGADGPHVVLDVIDAFRQQNPHVRVKTLLGNAVETWAVLVDMKVDVAVLAGSPDDFRVFKRTVAKQSLVALVPRGHRLASRQSLTLELLADEEVIFRETGSSTQKTISAGLQARQMQLFPTLVLGSREAVLAAVKRGMGIGFAYDREVESDHYFVSVPVDGFENANNDEVACLKTSRKTPHVKSFLECAREISKT